MNDEQSHLAVLARHCLDNEQWLMERILHYALQRQYTKYTSTLVEAWRQSIAGLSAALVDAINSGRTELELNPDEDLTGDSIAAYAVLEARRHRQRGVSLAMFLGLMKYYRQAYLDLLATITLSNEMRQDCVTYLHRFYDRLEIAFCVEWKEYGDTDRLRELQEENRRMTNEKNLYLTALESHPDAIIVLDENGDIREMNSGAMAFFGLHRPPGTSYYQLRNGTSLAKDGALAQLSLGSLLPCLEEPLAWVRREQQSMELLLLPASPSDIYRRVVLSPMLDVSHKFQGIVAAFNDIDSSVQAYRQLQQEQTARQQAEQRLSSVLRSADQLGLVETAPDERHTITAFSAGIAKMSGYSAEEVLGRSPVEMLANPADAEKVLQVRALVVERGEPVSQELHFRKKDGSVLQTLVTVNPIWDHQRLHIDGFLSIVADISERKQLEQQMLQSEKMASIAGLAAGVAHEINTPLSAILQSLQIIEEGIDQRLPSNQEIASMCGLNLAALHCYLKKQELPFFLAGIRSAAENAARIVANLLQFSRPCDDRQQLADLHDLLSKSVELVKSDYQLRKLFNLLDIAVEKNYVADPLILPCIPQEIEQVFINLLKNALQAMAATPPEQRRITIATGREGNMLRIAISDTGCGMDHLTQRHIFDPFFTTKEVGQGTGLGLPVCHTIICQHHGGRIEVQSEPGRGSRFTLLLPQNEALP